MRTASLCLLASLISSPLLAGYPPYQKSDSLYAEASCDRHCHSRCCCKRRSSGDSANRSVPSGPVAESFPEMRAMPALMAMPTLTMFRAVSVEPNSRSARGATLCEDQDERLDELDARVEALHLRMQTMQRAVELQTQILEEIKLKGTIGGSKIPVNSIVAKTNEPAPPVAKSPSTKDALNLVREKLQAYKEVAEGDDVKGRIDDVLKALEAYVPLAD